jgi:class 3 adenylate cyclase
MKITAQTVNIALNVVVICGLIVSAILAGIIMESNHDTVQLILSTKALTSELRQSSDDLTRFIRTYTVTGNQSYWSYFNNVINIRNGVEPLPEEPWRNYWDLYISDGVPPRKFGKPSALLARIEDNHFTDDEFALLAKAAAESDALIEIEDIAYNAMNGRFRPTDTTGLTTAQAKNFSVFGPPNQTMAMQLVHSVDYHLWKGRIMRPLDDFSAKSTQRVKAKLDNIYQQNVILVAVLSSMLLMLIVLLVIYFLKVSKDSQTQHLLNAVLPVRVVDTVTVSHFSDLKEVATQRMADIKSRRQRLKSGDKSKYVEDVIPSAFPVLYSEYLPVAWVAFTDVVSFTKMCRYTPSNIVISVLNEMFSLLDIAALNYGVEKIKTIGDAFMAAKLSTSELNDIPDDATQKAIIAQDGLSMVMFLLHACQLARGVTRPLPLDENGNEIPDEKEGACMQLRVGLNAGPCASGIVGFERPLYDLFGDTVNTAARLEASGRPNRVHILDSCLAHFGELGARELVFESWNDNVELKGLGSAKTRFVKGVRSLPDEASTRSSLFTPR